MECVIHSTAHILTLSSCWEGTEKAFESQSLCWANGHN